MADKKGKVSKHIDHTQQQADETGPKKNAVSDIFLNELKGAFIGFDKLSEDKKIELYGDKQYLDQFREYFKEEHPQLIDQIQKDDLPTYIKALEKKGFTLAAIKKNAGKLNEAFKAEDTELHVMEKSLEQLQNFCADKNNNIPEGTFKKFAATAGFTHDKLQIDPVGKLKTVDSLFPVWTDFLKKEGIVIGQTSRETIETILTPNYNPTERIMVTVAITKIGKELKGDLKAAFDAYFLLPIDVFSPYQDLITFRDEWSQFVGDHAAEISQSLAKKLDSIIVTNGDIHGEFLKSGKHIDTSKGFSEKEKAFTRIFNNLVTRQLFEEVKKTQETIDRYIGTMSDTFKAFPPYVNDIMNIDPYRFNDTLISAIDVTFHADLEHIDNEIVSINSQYAAASEEERKLLRQKMKALKQKKEERRWQAYIAFLTTKNPDLANVFSQLVAKKFDFSCLSSAHQQLLTDILVKNKLEETIKNKVPELLDVKEEDLISFINDLFDLKKMDLVVPTRHGPVSLTFLKKEFLASARTQLPALSDLEDLKNLPLNFVTQLTESNAAFFEDSVIFDSLYTDIKAKNGPVRVSDAYKVKIKKDGKEVEGYLSSYSPINEKNLERSHNGKELYLYSEPISAPNQERKLVTWDGSDAGVPVIIKDAEQQVCDVEVLDKKLNLNGDAFGALLFGYVLGQQSMNFSLSHEKEHELAKKFGDLETYKEKENENEEEIIEEKNQQESSEKPKESSEQEKFMDEWKKLKGAPFSEEKYMKNAGLVEGTRLFIPFTDSQVPPLESNGKAWLQMEIINVDQAKGTFKVKLHGGELGLGKVEGATKELSMNASSIEGIRKAFGNTIFKIPTTKGTSFENQMETLIKGSIAGDLDKYFGSVKFNGSAFRYTLGNYSGKEITHFGLYEPKANDEAVDQETGRLILYKIHPNANGTITVSGDSTAGNYAKHFPSRDMDYTTFMLFIKEKGLQPKCKEQIETINAKEKELKEETPTTVRGFSINSLVGFFKNSVNKIKDGMKKYDEGLTEDLTDLLTSQGQLWNKVGSFLSPFGRIASSFENMGMEYFMERDNRIWKKVEKRQKFYEDFDYTKIYMNYIKPMLDGTLKIVPHYKMAALLLVHLKKGKGPYAKDPKTTASGSRVGALLGKEHQKRYLAIREKKIRDLEQNAHIYGGPWADQVKNELVELEMRYIVHVMDGRHMGIQDNDKTKYYFQEKYSKKFCDELEGAYTGFFKQSTVEEGFTKNQDVNFEFARFEYFRQLADRPQQALPFLKVMATKAINATQWQVFETAVMAGMLSGVFLNMTYAATQSYVQKICRTRGFVPGIFAKDIKQQSKMQRLLDLFSGGDFTKQTKYTPADFSYRENIGPGKFITAFKDWTDSGSTRNDLSKFFEMKGKNVEGKTLLDIYSDPKLSLSDKLLLEEYINKTNEKDETLDNDVIQNTSSLTGSILTKSQSVVDKMIRFDKGGFAGKDGDEIQNMKAFSENMQQTIPSERLDSQETVKFFIEKFFNRFGERGFSGNRMTEFLKRLKWCKENAGSPEVDDVMYYSVVGEIINALASHDANPPDELMGALGKWKDFFKNNLDNILQPDVISSCFGGSQYKADYDKAKPLLESRDSAAVLLDREDNAMYMYTLNKEEKQQALAKKRAIANNRNCINKDLYKLAEDLARKCSGFSNRFKREVHDVKKTAVSASKAKATGAKIKNPEVIEKVRQILEGKPIEENNPDEYIPPMEDPYDFY